MEFPQCYHCGLKGGDQAGGVHTGLDASEMVVRGGRLSAPTLLTGLIFGSNNRRFLRLRKGHEGLCRFLTGQGSYQCPLAKTAAFETIRLRREDAMRALGEAMFKGPAAEAAEEEPEADPMSALGIDEPPSWPCRPQADSRRIKRMRKSAAKQAMPSSSVTVCLGQGLQIEVLAESGKCLPAIEATASSLWAVFRLIQQELDGCEESTRQKKV